MFRSRCEAGREELSGKRHRQPNRTIGGNDAPGVESNYIVLVGPPVDMTCHPSGKVDISDVTSHTRHPELPYRVAELHTKQPYYVDRSYVLTPCRRSSSACSPS